MARHDDRERVAPERLPDGARRTRRAHSGGNVAIRQGHAWWYGPRSLIDTAVKARHPLHVERDGREIARLAAQQRHDAVDDTPHLRRRRSFPGSRKPLKHAGARFPLTRFRELDTGDATLTPRDATPADCRVKECEAARHHDAILTCRQRRDLENLAVRVLVNRSCSWQHTLGLQSPMRAGCPGWLAPGPRVSRCRPRCFRSLRGVQVSLIPGAIFVVSRARKFQAN